EREAERRAGGLELRDSEPLAREVGVVLQAQDRGHAVHVAQPDEILHARVLADEQLGQHRVETRGHRSHGAAAEPVPGVGLPAHASTGAGGASSGANTKRRPSSPASISTLPPSFSLPKSISSASGRFTCSWMSRAMGRAPKTLS